MGFNIDFKDIIDIFLVAFLLYQTYKLLKKTGALDVFLGVLTFIIVWFLVSSVFKMELLGGILDRIVSLGSFALIVLFQEEIRRFFSNLGSRRSLGIITLVKKIFKNDKEETEGSNLDIAQIVLACKKLSRDKLGALIIIKEKNNIDLYIQSGEIINANINARLIENIFFKNSPLHDGAMIISERKIRAAGCILPVSKNKTIPKELGLRHRAALGITEVSDAIAIVISEETGRISWAINGEIAIDVKPEQLEHFLSVVFSENKN